MSNPRGSKSAGGNPVLDTIFQKLQESKTAPDATTLRQYMERYLMIIPKGQGGSRRPIKLRLNAIQDQLNRMPYDRLYILKARQVGSSTYQTARLFAKAALIPGTNALILAHTDGSARTLFRMIQTYFNQLPTYEKRRLNGAAGEPFISNMREIVFAANGSRIACQTAGSKAGARGSTLTDILLSEVAFYGEWAGDVVASLEGALVPGGSVVLETTPEPAGTWAYEMWRRCLEDTDHAPYHPIFFPWWESEEYTEDPAGGNEPYSTEEWNGIQQHGWTKEQIAWRRKRRAQFADPRLFDQEYPNDPLSAWVSRGRTVFPMEHVTTAYGGSPPVTVDNQSGYRQYVPPDPFQNYVIGVDPAEGVQGGDYTAIQIFSESGEQCAERLDYIPIHQLAEWLLQLPYHGVVAIERNNHGHALIELLIGRGLKLELDKDNRFGLLANRQSKARWISRAMHGFHQRQFRLRSYRLYQQLVQYVYDDQGRAGGPEKGGDKVLAHDDAVSAFLLVAQTLVDDRGGVKESPFTVHVTTPKKRRPSTDAQAESFFTATYTPDSEGLYLPPDTDFRLPAGVCSTCYKPLVRGRPNTAYSLTHLLTHAICPACGQPLDSAG